jgi:hypothetical protein
MAADRPTPEFGKRRPAPIPTAQPVKRSNHVALLLMGSFAVGGGALALMPGQNCAANPPGVASGAPASAACPPGGSSSGGHGGSWSRSGFFGSDSSSGRSGILSGVSRGGFGSFAGGFSRGG